MGAEDGQLVALCGVELPQPVLVGVAQLVVLRGDRLERAQRRRAGARRGLLTGVEVGIAGVQQPATIGAAYGHGHVASAVPVQRHQHDVVPQRGDRGEAEPLVAGRAVADPLRTVRPLGRDVATLLHERRRVERRLELGLVDVHARLGEVAEPARVVEVHVGEHDVGDVGRVQAERPDPSHRRLRRVERRDAPGRGTAGRAASGPRGRRCRSRCRRAAGLRAARRAGSARPSARPAVVGTWRS